MTLSCSFYYIVFSDNLIYLEHALEKICRPDLVTDVLDYKESVLGNSEEKGEISGPARKYKGGLL